MGRAPWYRRSLFLTLTQASQYNQSNTDMNSHIQKNFILQQCTIMGWTPIHAIISAEHTPVNGFSESGCNFKTSVKRSYERYVSG